MPPIPFTPADSLAVLAAFALAAALTPLVRAAARRAGVVARPKADRWHTKPTAMLGGVAMVLAFVPLALIAGPQTLPVRALLAGSLFLFAVGLVDDLVQLKPYQKLAGQILAASGLVFAGFLLPWTGLPPCDIALTIFWIIGITNAVNMLDNMDGLAAGIAAIAAATLAAVFLAEGQTAQAVLLAAFAAVMLGFLLYNSNPASIFMGDCGALFVGFFLAGAALLTVEGGRSRAFLPVLAVPVLTLLLPIFDTTLVTVVRKLAGRPASQGGRDHTSHRLVALGVSERRAVWILYLLAGASGIMALTIRQLPVDAGLAVIVAFSVILVLVGVALAHVRVYQQSELAADRKRPVVALLMDLSYKRRIFEVLLDVVLVILAYHTAQTLLYGPIDQPYLWKQFGQAVPVLVGIKLAVYLLMGVYRGLWRYVNVEDLVNLAKATALGSAAGALALLVLFRFQGFSRAVFVLDGLLLFAMVAASRLTFRFFRYEPVPLNESPGRRTLIYGAGDGGELLLRELRNNPVYGCRVVGLIDDDPRKADRILHGLRVHAGNGHLADVLARQNVEMVVLSSRKFTQDRIREIVDECAWQEIPVRRMYVHVEDLPVPDPMRTLQTTKPR